MASSDQQLHKDIRFGTTARDAGVIAALEIRIYDKEPHYSIGNTPRNSREEVLIDINRIIDILESQSAQRRTAKG